MCSDLEELNLKVVMTGVEMTLEMMGEVVGMGQKLWGWGQKVVGMGRKLWGGGVMDLKVVWIRGGCSHIEVLGSCD